MIFTQHILKLSAFPPPPLITAIISSSIPFSKDLGLAATYAGRPLRAHLPGDVSGREPGRRDRRLRGMAAEGLGDIPDKRRHLETGTVL